eukprot:GHRQ01009164.1.p1 GENE.GHRQ01009164.1~~GHRQ01009164.1.p1  ORF type:complete len:108 (+),score=50.71 GHRQ01009164.1:309-632(+)
MLALHSRHQFAANPGRRITAAAAAFPAAAFKPVSTSHFRSQTVAMASVEQLHATAGVCAAPDASTKDFILQQTMLRVKEPTRSLDFYTRVLGMTLLAKLDFPDMKFT